MAETKQEKKDKDQKKQHAKSNHASEPKIVETPFTTVVSAHGDTNWRSHKLEVRDGPEGVEYYGHMDNFGGVYATMQAYFSGKLPQEKVRIEITYGEETFMEGAKEVAKTLKPWDLVIVIDVTGVKTKKSVTFEKVYNKRLRKFLQEAMKDSGISYDLFLNCPDPIATQDETDVYRKVTDYTFFLGLPVRGGDYNAGPVYCWKRDLDAVSATLIAISNAIKTKGFVTIPANQRSTNSKPAADEPVLGFASLNISDE